MQNSDWKYHILDEMGRGYRKENGLVVAKNDIKPLKYTPSGWQDISVAWERDLVELGMVRNFTLPLQFVLDGADIMRSLLYGSNFDKKIYLLIQKQKLYIDVSQYYYYYDFFYKGEIDLSTHKDEEDTFTVNIAEKGIAKDLAANRATNYEIPVDELLIEMNGFPLYKTGYFSMVDGFEMSSRVAGAWTLPIVNTSTDGAAPGVFFQNQYTTSTQGFTFSDATIDTIIFPILLPSVMVRVKGKLKFKVTFNDVPAEVTFSFRLVIRKNDNTAVYTIAVPTPGGNTAGTIHDHDFDYNVILGRDQKVTFELVFQGFFGSAQNMGIEFLTGSDFTGSFNNTFYTTYIKAVYARTLFARLAERISPGMKVASSILDAFKDLTITSFDAVRGLAGAVIKTNLNDFLKSINAVLATGSGVINNTYYIEDRQFFFKEENIIPLGKVKTPIQTQFKDLQANHIKIGYEPQDVNAVTDINGKQEFNTTAEYSTNIKKVVKTLELISVYRADPFGIENGRLNLNNKKTTADNADNDVCFLAIDSMHPQVHATLGTYYPLKRVAYDVVTGLLDPTRMFNIELLSPRRMFMRHAPWFNSIMNGFEGQKIKFETLTRNRDLYTKKGTEIFDEDADYTITTAGRILQAEMFEVIPEAPNDLVEQLELNPSRCFSFIHPRNNLTYTGFNYKIGIAPNTLQEQAFLLISSASNDLKTLIT